MSTTKQLSVDDILKLLKTIVADLAEVEIEYLDDHMNLFEDLGLDSMMYLQTITAVEDKLKIKIIGDNFTPLPTLYESATHIENLLKKSEI